MHKRLYSFLISFGVVLAMSMPFAASAVNVPVTLSAPIVYDTSVIISGYLVDLSIPDVSLAFDAADGSQSGETIAMLDRSGGKFVAEVGGLDPATKYYYQIIDTATGVALTKSLSFTTKNTLYGFTITKVTETSANLFGQVAVAKPDLSILWGEQEVTEYQHEFSPNIRGDKKFSEDLVDLLPNTKYKVLFVKRSNPNVRLGGPYGFQTLSIIAAPYTINIKDKTATIGTRLPKKLSGVKVYYGLKSNALENEEPMIEGDEGVYTASLQDLSPNTEYFYKVVGRDDTGAPVVYGSTTVIGLDTNGNPLYMGSVFSFRTQTNQAPVPTKVIQDTVGKFGIVANTDATKKGLVPDCTGVDKDGNTYCTFKDFLKLVNTVIGYLVFVVMPTVGVIVLMVAGFIMLTSQGSAEKVSQAKSLITRTFIAILIVTGAWLIVKTVFVTLGYDSSLFPNIFN